MNTVETTTRQKRDSKSKSFLVRLTMQDYNLFTQQAQESNLTRSKLLRLYIRNKKPKDKIEVLGLNGHKLVSDIFIEKKVPLSLRNNYPLLVDSKDNILWIPNLKKSKFNIKNNENYDIILEYCEKEEK